MRLADADTLYLFAHIFITQYKYQIITQIHKYSDQSLDPAMSHVKS